MLGFGNDLWEPTEEDFQLPMGFSTFSGAPAHFVLDQLAILKYLDENEFGTEPIDTYEIVPDKIIELPTTTKFNPNTELAYKGMELDAREYPGLINFRNNLFLFYNQGKQLNDLLTNPEYSEIADIFLSQTQKLLEVDNSEALTQNIMTPNFAVLAIRTYPERQQKIAQFIEEIISIKTNYNFYTMLIMNYSLSYLSAHTMVNKCRDLLYKTYNGDLSVYQQAEANKGFENFMKDFLALKKVGWEFPLNV